MNYNELNPNETAVTIVFGGMVSERNAFQAAFLNKYPAFHTEMHPCLKNYKKPLLGGQKSIVDYLAKQAKKGERGLTEQQLKHMIVDSAKRLGIDHLTDRYVPALSSRQKFLFSLILEECSQVSRSVFIRDNHHSFSGDDCIRIADWFARTCGNAGHIVLLVELSTEKMADYLQLAEHTAFYQLEQGQLMPFDISSAYARYKQQQKEELEQIFNKGVTAYKSKDYANALLLFEKSAGLGDAVAQFYCGEMYDYGKGTAVDKAKALMWYEKAAQQGDTDAQFRYGEMYYMGEGTAVDKSKALYWFQKSALQANHLAMVYLAGMYRRGDGTAVNKTEAFALYGILARVGVSSAQCICGEMCYNGEGTKKDKDEAKMWYEKAARQTQNKDIQEKAKKALREYF